MMTEKTIHDAQSCLIKELSSENFQLKKQIKCMEAHIADLKANNDDLIDENFLISSQLQKLRREVRKLIYNG